VAAPTAGLHFTENLLQDLKNMGVKISYVTLHVALGTFESLASDCKKSELHQETFFVSAETAKTVNEAKESGHSVFAVEQRWLEAWNQQHVMMGN